MNKVKAWITAGLISLASISSIGTVVSIYKTLDDDPSIPNSQELQYDTINTATTGGIALASLFGAYAINRNLKDGRIIFDTSVIVTNPEVLGINISMIADNMEVYQVDLVSLINDKIPKSLKSVISVDELRFYAEGNVIYVKFQANLIDPTKEGAIERFIIDEVIRIIADLLDEKLEATAENLNSYNNDFMKALEYTISKQLRDRGIIPQKVNTPKNA